MTKKILQKKQMKYIGLALLLIMSIVLIAVFSSPEYKYGRFVKAGKINQGPYVHHAVKLQDNRILVMENNADNEKTVVETYDRKTGKFITVKTLPYRMTYATLTLLRNGNVFIAGYSVKTGLNKWELTDNTLLFDPKNNIFIQGPKIKFPRYGHTASLLPDGRVLIIGGTDNHWRALKDNEIYDPALNKIYLGPKNLNYRRFHRAVSLSNGDVIIIGGENLSQREPLLSKQGSNKFMIEKYNFKTNSFSRAGYLCLVSDNFNYNYSAICSLKDGRILIVVGEDSADSCTKTEIYDPFTEKSVTLNTISGFRAENPTLTALKNGNAILIGGLKGYFSAQRTLGQTYIYDSRINRFILGPLLNIPRIGQTVVELDDGSLLVIGGLTDAAIATECLISK